jgi:uncharacterized membrane protein
MRRLTVFSLLLFIVMLFLLPVIFTQIMQGSLIKLHLSPQTAFTLTLAIILGGLINVPVGRLRHQPEAVVDPLAIFGISGFMQRMSNETVIALNVGGCIIPTCLALYEFGHLAASGEEGAALIASLVSTLVCYATSRVVPGVGIAMPALLAPGVSAASAILLAGDMAPPVAFIAGVAGPLIGADLLHLREIKGSPVGVASIGGAGTFDGIVLSGIVAAYLA